MDEDTEVDMEEDIMTDIFKNFQIKKNYLIQRLSEIQKPLNRQELTNSTPGVERPSKTRSGT